MIMQLKNNILLSQMYYEVKKEIFIPLNTLLSIKTPCNFLKIVILSSILKQIVLICKISSDLLSVLIRVYFSLCFIFNSITTK